MKLQFTPIEGEKWVPLINYEGYYEVSDLGRIKSLPRDFQGKNGPSKLKECILRAAKNNKGYLVVTLRKRNDPKTYLINRLVYMSFYGHTDLDIDHIIENNPTDNRLCNLQALTDRANVAKHFLLMKKDKSSKYTGVCFNGKAKKWQVNVRFDGKRYCLGHHQTEEEAALVYQKAVKDYTDNGIHPPPAYKSSKYQGVTWAKRNNKWLAYFHDGRANRYIGLFAIEEDAYKAYKKAKGEFKKNKNN